MPLALEITQSTCTLQQNHDIHVACCRGTCYQLAWIWVASVPWLPPLVSRVWPCQVHTHPQLYTYKDAHLLPLEHACPSLRSLQHDLCLFIFLCFTSSSSIFAASLSFPASFSVPASILTERATQVRKFLVLQLLLLHPTPMAWPQPSSLTTWVLANPHMTCHMIPGWVCRDRLDPSSSTGEPLNCSHLQLQVRIPSHKP